MRALYASVGAQITLHDVEAPVVCALRRHLSFPNPEYETFRRFGEDPPAEITPRLCCVEEFPNASLAVPRGALDAVRLVASACGFAIKFRTDNRSKGSDLGPLPLSSLSLRDYQETGVAELKRLVQGLVVLPCGSGKTTLGIASIASLRRTTLVIVHTLDLAQQWCEGIERHLGIAPARFCGGKHELGPITVATVQSLFSRPDTDLSSFGLCIHDECHRAPARTSQEVLSRCPARWRLGLTATPEREDGLAPLVQWSFGDTILEMSVDELATDGWLLLPRVVALATDFNFSCPEHFSSRQRTNLLRQAVVRDPHRNSLVADAISDRCAGHTSLVLTNDKSHCDTLAALLKDRGHDPVVITSDVAKGKRQKLLESLRGGSCILAIATSLADEGLDVPRLSRVFLALPERAKGRTKQRAGRLMRPFGDHRAELIDFVDSRVPTLLSRWRSRRSVYVSLGLEVSDLSSPLVLPGFEEPPRAS